MNDKLLTNDWVLVKDLVFKLIADQMRLLYIAHVNAIDGLAPNIEDDLVGEAENMHGVCDVSRDGLVVKVDCSTQVEMYSLHLINIRKS